MKGLQQVLNKFFKLKRINKIQSLRYLKSIARLLKKLIMSDVVQYTIQDKASYHGNIGHIMEKNGQKKWVSQIPLEVIQISLKMKNSSYINRVQVRGYQTEILQIIFKDIDKEFIDSTTISIETGSKDNAIVKNISHSQMTAFVDLRLKSFDGKPKPMGLNFILFRGEQNPLKTTKQKFTNLTKQQSIDKVKLDTIRPPLIKSKPAQIGRPYKNLAKPINTIFNQRQKRNVDQKQRNQKPSSKQEDEIQKAIKESQRTYNEQMKIKNLSKEKNCLLQIEKGIQDSDTMPLIPERNYQVASYDSMKNFLQYYSSNFVQAQRKAQIAIGVRQQQRLSNYIHVKHLLNREVYIDQGSIKEQRKAKLQNIAEKLGAKIIPFPKNYCLLISTSWENSIVQNSVAKFSGIKAVNEDYLIECKKLNALLDWKDYSLKK